MANIIRDKQILDKLDEIINEGRLLNDEEKKYGNPKDYLEMTKIVFNFIKKKGLILYGGEAIDKNLKKTKKSPGIYTSQSKPDYDFYSYDYEKDSIELCNLLHDSGYKYVRRIPRIHRGTFAVYANTAILADITYIPKNIFNKIPTIVVDKVYYINPLYTIKNLYLGLTRPRLSGNYARWEKDWERLQLMNKLFPLKPVKENKLTKTNTKAIDFLLKKFVYRNPQVVITGQHAIHFIQNTQVPPVVLDIISVDSQAENHVKMIERLLTEGKFGKVDVLVFAPFLGDLPTRMQISVNGVVILNIYAIDHECVSIIKDDNYNYTNFYYLMHFLLSQYFYSNVYPEYTHTISFNSIVQLYKNRESFLKKNNLIGVEPAAGRYKVLDSECIGIQKSDNEITREQVLAGIQQYPHYYPEFEYINISEYTPSIIPPNYDGKLLLTPSGA